MRRHMFVNSRRSGAQTTVDHLGLRMYGGGGPCDSMMSYDGPPTGFMASASFASNSNVSYKDAPASSPLAQTSTTIKSNTNPNATTTITTTKVEIINEYAVVRIGFEDSFCRFYVYLNVYNSLRMVHPTRTRTSSTRARFRPSSLKLS